MLFIIFKHLQILQTCREYSWRFTSFIRFCPQLQLYSAWVPLHFEQTLSKICCVSPAMDLTTKTCTISLCFPVFLHSIPHQKTCQGSKLECPKNQNSESNAHISPPVSYHNDYFHRSIHQRCCIYKIWLTFLQ